MGQTIWFTTEFSVLVEQLVGWMCLILGASLIVTPNRWSGMFDALTADVNNPLMLALMLFFALPFGLLIVLVHNEWGFHINVVITLFGWIAIIEALLYLFAPNILFKLIPKGNIREKMIRIEGVIIVLFMAWLLWVIR